MSNASSIRTARTKTKSSAASIAEFCPSSPLVTGIWISKRLQLYTSTGRGSLVAYADLDTRRRRRSLSRGERATSLLSQHLRCTVWKGSGRFSSCVAEGANSLASILAVRGRLPIHLQLTQRAALGQLQASALT